MLDMKILPAVGALAALLCALPAFSQTLTTVRVASGLAKPHFVTHAPGDPDRIFIVEQRSGSTGRIRVLDLTSGTLLASPFLSVTGVTTGNEQGFTVATTSSVASPILPPMNKASAYVRWARVLPGFNWIDLCRDWSASESVPPMRCRRP